MKTPYGFVILHYMAYDMTVKCVDTLLETFTGKGIFIVIVDNASPNLSGKRLEVYYEARADVMVLRTKENLGFARGNNIGYEYLRNRCEYITVINNDVLIYQSDFLERICALYQRERYAVLGPDIYNPSGIRKHQNPFFMSVSSKVALKKRLNAMEAHLRHFLLYYIRTRIYDTLRNFLPFVYIYRKIRSAILRTTVKNNGGGYVQQCENPVLHGACYVFSADFIRARRYAFYPKTFLYGEEEILHYQCMRAGLKMLYSPEIQVLHLEDVSTDMVLGKRYNKEKFKLENMIASLHTFLDLMEEAHD